MPVTKQASKKVSSDRRKTVINLKVKKALKRATVSFSKKPTADRLKMVFKAADKAAKKNIIHKNKAARVKARFYKLLNKKTVKQTT